jgi:CBS domain-containing protein
MATVEKIMTTPVVAVAPGDNVADAARRMRDGGVGAVLVVEGKRLRGIFTERDVVERVVAEGRDPATTAVSEVHTAEPRTVPATAHVRECVGIIREGDFRHVPVVDAEGQPVGVISTRVFLQHVVAALEGFVDRAVYREELIDGGTDPYEAIGGGYR